MFQIHLSTWKPGANFCFFSTGARAPRDSAFWRASTPTVDVTLLSAPAPASSRPSRPIEMEPPADVRVVIDGMAPFVARSGDAFVERIRATEAGNPKFAFVDPTSEWYPYFTAKVNEARAAQQQQQQQQQGNAQQQQQPPQQGSAQQAAPPQQHAAAPVVAEAQLDPAAKARLEKERVCCPFTPPRRLSTTPRLHPPSRCALGDDDSFQTCSEMGKTST